MSRKQKVLKRPNLVQCFEGPDEAWVGCWGWLCGYSADADFLDQAAERFTSRTAAQRASSGILTLAIILDPGQSPISILAAPGVAHLPIRDAASKPFALMHAKVALLGYRHRDNADEWLVRLIVSTGNWTRETMEDSLDLVWCVDVLASELNKPSEDTRRRCADIRAAHDLLGWLRTLYDTRLLDAGSQIRYNETQDALLQFDSWISLCAQVSARAFPRFLDNRKRSLLTQLPKMIRNAGVQASAKWLAMGSAYYEDGRNQTGVPSVLKSIISRLQESGLLSSRPNVHLFVNPDACQSVARSEVALAAADIRVHAPGRPPEIFGERCERRLHAKFLFGYNCRANSNNCFDAWVYLGSGNLTNPGFANSMHPAAGNLEAGVVFSPDNLVWENQEAEPSQMAVSNALPVQWDEEVTFADLQIGGSFPERADLYEAPPVAWLRWVSSGSEGGGLRASTERGFEVLDGSGNPCALVEDVFTWPGRRPRSVSIRWTLKGKERLVDVPVVDEFGRIAAAPLPKLELADAWSRLAGFPQYEASDDTDVEDDAADGDSASRAKSPRLRENRCAIREMMVLIEQLAERQITIARQDWNAWCCRLEQTLSLLADSEGVREFQKLNLNPLQPLRARCFRPSYAESGETSQGLRYEQLLDLVEEKWATKRLCAMGVAT